MAAVLGLTACGGAKTAETQVQVNGKTEAQTQAKAVTLKLAHTQSTEHPVHKSIEKFAELVKEKTNGEVTVEIYANGVLGEESILSLFRPAC